MTVVLSEVYFALRSANVPEDRSVRVASLLAERAPAPHRVYEAFREIGCPHEHAEAVARHFMERQRRSAAVARFVARDAFNWGMPFLLGICIALLATILMP